ncbi:MAG: DMT family transporter [Chromatiaceae bacterium]|nr:DMT family transporter [Chromatiaceae bacterium]
MESRTRQRDTLLRGSLLVVLGAIGFSTKPILIKLAYGDAGGSAVDAITLMALRMLIALPVFLAVALWHRNGAAKEHRAGDWAALVVLGVTGYYLASLLDFSGLEYISAGLERLILFLYPTFVVLLSALLYRRRISRVQGIALLLSYAGILLVYGVDPLANSPDIATGALLVLASGMVFALYLIGSGHFIPRFGSRRFTAYSMSIASVVTLAHFLAFHPVTQLLVSKRILGLAIALAVFSTILPAFLINAGIRRIGADQTAVITSIGPVVTLALAYVLLSESLGPAQIGGAALVLLGVMLVGMSKRAN